MNFAFKNKPVPRCLNDKNWVPYAEALAKQVPKCWKRYSNMPMQAILFEKSNLLEAIASKCLWYLSKKSSETKMFSFTMRHYKNFDNNIFNDLLALSGSTILLLYGLCWIYTYFGPFHSVSCDGGKQFIFDSLYTKYNLV